MSNLITPTLCIYHGNCADGFGAAFVVWLRYGYYVKYVAANYGEAPPDCAGHDVLLVDFSYKLPELELILEQAKSVTILDHHKTAEADIQPLLDSGRIHGEFDMNRSGAALAWDWCYPGEDRVRLIEYIQDRDLWHFHLEGTREIGSVLFSYEQQFDIWLRIMNDLEDDEARQQVIQQGEALQRKHMKDVREAVRLTGRLMNICGYTVPVANVPYIFASDAGNLMAEGRPFAATYVDTESGRKFSLRSKEGGIDVSEIAKRFGGGGHARAAGFQVPIGWEGGDHVVDANNMVQGDVVSMGDLQDENGTFHTKSFLLTFSSVEDFLAAMKAGQCRFTVLGGEMLSHTLESGEWPDEEESAKAHHDHMMALAKGLDELRAAEQPASAQGGQGAEPVSSIKSCACQFTTEGKLLKECLYHQTRYKPQPAVPEGWRKAARGAIEFAKDGLCETHPLTAAEHIKGMASLILSAAPTPEAGQSGGVPFAWLVENTFTGSETLYRSEAQAKAHRCLAVEIDEQDSAKVITPLYTHPHNGEKAVQGGEVLEALKDMLAIVRCHQNATGNNFAWAEVEFAEEVLAKIDDGEQGGEWVRCDERLPTEADGNLIWSHDQKRGSVELCSWAWSHSLFKHGYITHWQPTGLTRPQPPQSKEGEGNEH